MSNISVYSQPGSSLQQIGGECPDSWIEMVIARPGTDYIATDAGEWAFLPSVPRTVSRYQGREAMRLTPYGDGSDLFTATEILLTRPETPPYYRTAWDELQQFEFDSPMLQAIADELGLTCEDRAQLFRFAATLRA